MFDADQHVLQSRTGPVVIVDVVGGHQRQGGLPSDLQQPGAGQVLRLQPMLLQFEEKAAVLKHLGVRPRQVNGLAAIPTQHRGRNRALQAA